MTRTLALAVGLVSIAIGTADAAEATAPARTKSTTSTARGKAFVGLGRLTVLGEVAALDVASGGGKAVLVDFRALKREQRAVITAKCSPGCDVRVVGSGGDVLREVGVIARNLSIIDKDAPTKLASE